MIKVGDVMLFDPDKKYHWIPARVTYGDRVKVTKVGQEYTYYGLKPGETCFRVDFEVIETGEMHFAYSSQYLQDEGVDF